MTEHRNAPRPWWICLALAAITIAVFSPLFHYDFLTFDDQIYVTENAYVLTGLNSNSLTWAFHASTSGNWLPLTWISHMLDFQCYGLKAGGHHLTNVLFHAANVVLLFLLLQKMTGAIWRSALVAALFAWHPAHVESVAWIAERKDVLSSFFMLLTLLAYVRYAQECRVRGGKGKIFYLSVIALFALGLMAKSMLVTLPFVLLLLDFWPLERMSRPTLRRLIVEKTPLFALSAACCAVTFWAQQRSHAVASSRELPFWHRSVHALASYFDYIVMLIFPRHLTIYYPYPAQEQIIAVIAGAAILVLLSAYAIASARRRPWLPVGWFWFIGMLVPVIGLVQVGDQALADRYTYLPAIGFFICVVWGATELAQLTPRPNSLSSTSGGEGRGEEATGSNRQTDLLKTPLPNPLPALRCGAREKVLLAKFLASAALLALLAATWTQVHYWKDTRTVFGRALQVTRHNFLALTLLGSIRSADGDLAGGMELYREALHDKPNYPEAHFFYAKGLEQQGKIDEAKAEYGLALRLNPAFEQAHIFLGLLLAKEKNYEAAAAEYEAVLEINPRSAPAHNDLARLLQTQGRLDESVRHYLAALQYDSSLAQAHNNLGILYLQKGRLADGVAQLREALRLNPGNAETEYNLALGLNQQQQWKEASELLQRIAPTLPNNANAQYQYGVSLARQGKTREAMSRFAQSLLLTPDFPEALNALAWIAATAPHPELRNAGQAVEMATRACELTARQQPEMLLTLAAAYAEAGQFNEAMTAAEKGGEIAKAKGNKELEEKATHMRNAFEKSQPFRDP